MESVLRAAASIAERRSTDKTYNGNRWPLNRRAETGANSRRSGSLLLNRKEAARWQPRCPRKSRRPVALRPHLSVGLPFGNTLISAIPQRQQGCYRPRKYVNEANVTAMTLKERRM